MRTLLVFILALTAWSHPIHAASALLTEPKTGEIVQVNYGPYEIPRKPEVALGSTPVHKVQSIPVPVSSGYSGRHYSKEEVIQLIIDYSRTYRIESDTPLCIAKKESGYNQFSANSHSSARGVFQYLSGTWKATDEGKAGLSVFDADANVRAAVKYMAIHKSTRPWVVGPTCPSLRFL